MGENLKIHCNRKLTMPLYWGWKLSSLSLRERVRVRGLHENKTKKKFSTVEFVFETIAGAGRERIEKINSTDIIIFKLLNSGPHTYVLPQRERLSLYYCRV